MTRAEKLAYLNEVAVTVRTIQSLIQVGADARALRAVARDRGDVAIDETPGAMVLR